MSKSETHTPLCGCGSCQDAIDAAFRTMEQMLEHQCFHWFVAVVMVQAKVVQGVVDTDPDAALRGLRMETYIHDHADELGERLEAMLERGGHYAARVN